MHTLGLGTVELVAGTHVKRVVETGQVAERSVGAELRRGVRNGDEHLAQILVTQLRPPNPSPGEKKSLLAGQAVDDRRRLVLQRQQIRTIRNRQTTQIADVFAKRQRTVDMLAWQRRIAAELLDERDRS